MKKGIYFLLPVAFLCVLFLSMRQENNIHEMSNQIAFNQGEISLEEMQKNKTLRDLIVIARALNEYKRVNRSYPMQPWNSLVQADGSLEHNWIKGLVPDFISELPRDPRLSNDPAYQYGYMSNGANYKLIASYPDDCREVKNDMPNLVVPFGDCVGYGLWSSETAVYMY